MHGFSSSPQQSLAIIRPLAEAGFIVPAPPLCRPQRPRRLQRQPVQGRLRSHHPDPRPQHSRRPAGRPRQHSARRRCLRPLDGRHDHPRPAHVMARRTDHRRDPHVLRGHGRPEPGGPREGPVHARRPGRDVPDLLRPPGVPGTARRQGVPYLPRRRPQQLLRRLPDRQHVRGLDAVESVQRHRGPRPPSRRRHLQHDHLGIRPALRSNHARPGCVAVVIAAHPGGSGCVAAHGRP
ncbi:hypothetical protein ACIQV8_33815 [Streptomyces collinus]|uniref:hypothetical protein n=1 Tax=Streptomyces collinus TaxID=42684 RepID=UPI0038219182